MHYYSVNSPVREGKLQRDMSDELSEARCPLCRNIMVARLGKSGPFFQCGCSAGRWARGNGQDKINKLPSTSVSRQPL